MAKSDIPFNLFFERYFPERSFEGAIDMSKIHSNQEYAAEMNKFFDTIFAVTFEDIKSLSPEDLNCVPTNWLADWLHCRGGYYLEEMNFLDDLQKRREQYKKTIQSDLICNARKYMTGHKTFTAHELQEALSISHEEFLKLAYIIIIQGWGRYQDGHYTVV